MMGFLRGLLAVFMLVRTWSSDALECYTCTNSTYVSECKTTIACNAGEICFADNIQTSRGMMHSFGCRQEMKCGTVVHKGNITSSGSFVGRSGVTGSCSECCQEQHCNRQLCQHAFSEKDCRDGAEINCVTVGAVINMCSDTNHAKTVCRRFCGLCDYVDGFWSTWLTWSACDVSCGNGARTRERKCTEPAPSGGGSDCIGNALETQSCTEVRCPVNGGWSSWTPWGSCSATCGIGLQRRDRSCSNPYPELGGDHCFGDARDDQICLANACADGGWADWSEWNSCSKSCGDGIKTRSRPCNNPPPSMQGKYCPGDSYQVATCNTKECAVTNGGWALWSSWTSCTATCNGGIKARFHDCSNPMPSAGGSLCTGSHYEVTGCNQQTCPKKLSAFTFTNPGTAKQYFTGLSSKEVRGHESCLFFCYDIRFTTRILQEGTYYSSSTGLFSCHYPGLYIFTANLLSTTGHINCVIMKNDVSTIRIKNTNPDDHDGSGTTGGLASATGTATLHLNQNDKVGIFCHHSTSGFDPSSAFSGYLVSADS